MHSAIFQNFNNSAAAPLSFTHLFATVFLFKLELFLQFFSKIHFWHFISKSSLTRRFHLSYILFINFLFSPDSIYIYIYSFYSPLSYISSSDLVTFYRRIFNNKLFNNCRYVTYSTCTFQQVGRKRSWKNETKLRYARTKFERVESNLKPVNPFNNILKIGSNLEHQSLEFRLETRIL